MQRLGELVQIKTIADYKNGDAAFTKVVSVFSDTTYHIPKTTQSTQYATTLQKQGLSTV